LEIAEGERHMWMSDPVLARASGILKGPWAQKYLIIILFFVIFILS
jgi:hypothetical protein